MLKKLNPFRSKKRVFDPSPKMSASGTVYIIKLTFSIRMNKTEWACADEQMIFSPYPGNKDQIMELPAFKNFMKRHPEGSVDMETFECELKTVKKEILKPGGAQNN
jgi:hypothetical protein